jgi:hypothetical protein
MLNNAYHRYISTPGNVSHEIGPGKLCAGLLGLDKIPNSICSVEIGVTDLASI